MFHNRETTQATLAKMRREMDMTIAKLEREKRHWKGRFDGQEIVYRETTAQLQLDLDKLNELLQESRQRETELTDKIQTSQYVLEQQAQALERARTCVRR